MSESEKARSRLMAYSMLGFLAVGGLALGAGLCVYGPEMGAFEAGPQGGAGVLALALMGGVVLAPLSVLFMRLVVTLIFGKW